MESNQFHVEARFSPGRDCWSRIAELIKSATRTIDVCVYTLTDDRLAGPLLDAHYRRGVKVRVITENEKEFARGSDIARLEEHDIQIVVDDDRQYMHNKFAIFDGQWLLTGSYNWTRDAREKHHENIVVTDDPRLVDPFQTEFEKLWKMYR